MAFHTVTKQFGVVIFMMILVRWGWCQNSNCDVNYCKSLFPTVFKDFSKKGTKFLCSNSDDTLECINKCLQTFFPDFDLISSNTSIASEVCSYDIEYDLNRHWNCIGTHFHRLVTCMSISGSMMPANISSQTLKHISCKKFKDALDCPYKILNDCDEDAIEIVNKLFSNVFKSSMYMACHLIPLNDVYNLPVTYSLSNSYLSTAACLDNLPNVAGNCFAQYLQTFDPNELYNCRDSCERPDGDTCLPPSLLKDFYIPLFSFGKYSCPENSAIVDTLQMQEPSKSSTATYSPGIIASEIIPEDIASTTNPTDENDYLIPSDQAKRNTVFSSNYDIVEASTLNYRLNTKETDLDKISSTTHSFETILTNNSVDSTEKNLEFDRLPPASATVSEAVNNGAYKLEIYLQYLVVNFIIVLVFL